MNATLKHAAVVQERYYSEKLHINTKDPSGSRKVVEDFLQASSTYILPLVAIFPGPTPRTAYISVCQDCLQFLALDKDIREGWPWLHFAQLNGTEHDRASGG